MKKGLAISIVTSFSKASLKITPRLIAILIGILIIPGVVFAAGKGYSYLQAKRIANKELLEETQEKETSKVKGVEDRILSEEKQIDPKIESKSIPSSPIPSPTPSPSAPTPTPPPVLPQPTPQEQIIYIKPTPLPPVQSGPSEAEQEFLDWLSAETEKKYAEIEARQQYCDDFYAEKNAALTPIAQAINETQYKIVDLYDEVRAQVRGKFVSQAGFQRLYESKLQELNRELAKLQLDYDTVSVQYGECYP